MKYILLSLIVIMLISGCDNSKKIVETSLPKFKELDMFLLGQSCENDDIAKFAVELQKTYDELKKTKLKTDNEYLNELKLSCRNNSQKFSNVKFIEQKYESINEKEKLYRVVSYYSLTFMKDKNLFAKIEYDVKLKDNKLYLVDNRLSLMDAK